MNEVNILLKEIQEIKQENQLLHQKMDAIRKQVSYKHKAAFSQKEIVEALGLKGPQRALLDHMKKTGILHSPITRHPLIYPGEIVRKAIDKISAGKVQV